MNTIANFENKFNPENNSLQFGGNSIQLSPEDIKIAKDCIKEGFIKIGVPCTIGFHLCYSYLCKKGFFSPLSLPGKIISVPVGIIFSTYFFYANTCAKKLKNHLEAKKQMKYQDQGLLSSEEAFYRPSEAFSGTVTDTKSIDSENYFSPVNLDYESFTPQEIKSESKKIKETTYDELRQQNRENYQRQLYSSSLQSDLGYKSSYQPVVENTTKEAEFKSSKIKNKYGDELEL